MDHTFKNKAERRVTASGIFTDCPRSRFHIDIYSSFGLVVRSVVLTQYNSQPLAKAFSEKLNSLGIDVYRHYAIDNYPTDVKLVVSDDGYGKNDFIKTEKSLVVVTAPGPGSYIMRTSTALRQDTQNSRLFPFGISR